MLTSKETSAEVLLSVLAECINGAIAVSRHRSEYIAAEPLVEVVRGRRHMLCTLRDIAVDKTRSKTQNIHCFRTMSTKSRCLVHKYAPHHH